MINVDAVRFTEYLTAEIAIAKRWLLKHAAEYDSAETNVRVGKGFDPGPGTPDNYRQQNILASQRRIDMIVWKGIQPTIIEYKDRIGLSAIGQLVTYRTLYADAFPGSPVALLLAVGASIGPDVDTGFAAMGIPFELV